MKESFFEASIRVDEEFDNAELAAKSNKPSENAKVEVLDLNLELSRIKNKLKEQDGSEKSSGTHASERKDSSKDAQAQK